MSPAANRRQRLSEVGRVALATKEPAPMLHSGAMIIFNPHMHSLSAKLLIALAGQSIWPGFRPGAARELSPHRCCFAYRKFEALHGA